MTGNGKSIIRGFGDIVDQFFGLTGSGIGEPPHYENKRTLLRLCESGSHMIDGAALANALVGAIIANWCASRDAKTCNPGQINWIFRTRGEIDPKNRGPEVAFERAVVRGNQKNHNNDKTWGNQIPTSSGLMGPDADGARNVDLVCKHQPGHFELIELKIAANTPLFAAVEILGYGALYAFSRAFREDLYPDQCRDMLLYPDKCSGRCGNMKEPHRLRLRVLAPQCYYQDYENRGGLLWLEKICHDGARALAKRACSPALNQVRTLEMDFAFHVFPSDFKWPAPEGEDEEQYAVNMANQRRRLYRTLRS